MQILNLESGTPFQMGKGKNWRVVHPDMGATQLTLNHGQHAPGQEFTQHLHDESEDMIVVLEGGGHIRQGDVYTPITAGEGVFVPAREVHGTVNTTGEPARLISFQSPPDLALYRGERDRPNDLPKPEPGHRSGVQVIPMAKAGPVFGKSGDWRSVVSPQKGSQHLSLDYVQLNAGEAFTHDPIGTESIYVLIGGGAEVKVGGGTSTPRWDRNSKVQNAELRSLAVRDVLFLKPGETFSLSQIGSEPATLLYCWALRP